MGEMLNEAALMRDIEQAINRHSRENRSNTPDFVLAHALAGALRAFEESINLREIWYGRSVTPGAPERSVDLDPIVAESGDIQLRVTPSQSDDPYPHLIDGDYSRENLTAICEAAVVPEEKWWDRDSPGAQTSLYQCWGLLKAGCDYFVHRHAKDGETGCYTDDQTIWLTVEWKSFSTFEYGIDADKCQDSFYLPTPKRLRARKGGDWY